MIVNDISSNVFIKDWTLLDFAKEFGKMQVGEFINKDTGDIFHACIFTNDNGNRTFVSFFSQLGELTAIEIKERKDELYVGLTEGGNYFLHSNVVQSWEDVELNDEEDSLEIVPMSSTDKLEDFEEHFKKVFEEKGLSFDKDAVKDVYDSLYDGSDDYDINFLTIEQKCALFGALTSLGKSTLLVDKKDEVAEVLRDFAETIKLYEESIDSITFNSIASNKNLYLEIIKTIHRDGPFIQFIFACNSLMDLDDYSILISYEFHSLLKDMGFSQEEIDAISNNRYMYRYK